MVGHFALRAGWFVATAAMVTLAAGCGGSGVLVSASTAPALRSTTVATPMPRTVMPSPAPTPATSLPRAVAKLSASLVSLQKATLGMGKATAQVEVTNPAPIALQGTVKVTFSATGRDPKIQTRSVTIPASGRETLSFVETAWFVKDATVEIETSNGGLDPHAPGTY